MNAYIMSGCQKANIKHMQFKSIKNFSGKNKQRDWKAGGKWEERADESFPV